MAEQTAAKQVLHFLDKKEITIEDVNQVQKDYFELADQVSKREQIRKGLKEVPSKDKKELKNLKTALVHWLVDEYEDALDLLEDCKGEVTYYLEGKILLSREDRNRALEVLEEGVSKHSDSWVLRKLLANFYLSRYELQKAEKLIKELAKEDKKHPDVLFLQSHLKEIKGHYEEAVIGYEEVLEKDPEHLEAHFRLAYHHNLRGDEDTAIEHYKFCQKVSPLYVHAWINLGLMYEDREDYEEAKECYKEVLRVLPNHDLARLYLEDCRFGEDMYYDEASKRRIDRRKQILRIPITDFELSVRARNCLNKMNIKTLGDLIQKTPDELLDYKNFGDNSLKEIEDILDDYNLSLGDGKGKGKSGGQGKIPPGAEEAPEEILNKSIEDFDFAKRSINCMQKLGIDTIRDLIQRSEGELMQVRNFGKVSLQDIKDKLAEFNLSLAKD